MPGNTVSGNGLQERLDSYMEQARANENKLRQFQDMELRLLSAESLPEFCRVLVQDYRRAFGLDIVTLQLIDGNNQLANIFNNIFQEEALRMHGNVNLLDFVELIGDYRTLQELESHAQEPKLATYNAKEHGRFFKHAPDKLGSVAILPLHRHGLLLGVLCLGSHDPGRYSADMATDFLRRLALIAGVGIENSVNIEFLRQLSLKDTLTSANNRRHFFQRLEEEINRAQRQSYAVGCLYLDLDNFKRINDHYGHAAGDMVLIHVANIVLRIIRNSDIFARLGGEEFAVALPNISKFRLGEIAERIRMMIESQPCDLTTDTSINVTVSVGLAYFDLDEVVGEPKELGEVLVNQADRALLYAKDQGRNRVCAYEDIAHLE